MDRPIVYAAGTIPWRLQEGTLEVALIHRPRYQDWSWPKGKLESGETLAACAHRETLEETGLEVQLGIPLPPSNYLVRGGGSRKYVAYWAAQVTGGHGRLEHEVDQVRWLPASKAMRTLSYPHDREQLGALIRAHERSALATRPLVLLRHAHALGRTNWEGEDSERPLDELGHKQAAALPALLRALAPAHLVSSPAQRCLDTIQPTADELGLAVEVKKGLRESDKAADAEKARRQVDRALKRPGGSVLVTHGPTLSILLRQLVEAVDPAGPEHEQLAAQLANAEREGLAKGEAIVAQIRTDAPLLVSVESHPPN